MEARQAKGITIAKTGQITRTDEAWLVPSQSGTQAYHVRLYADTIHEPDCDCPDHTFRGCKCKHIHAVEYLIQRETDKQGNQTVTKAMRVTYSQNWKAYNKAQFNEVLLFDKLLHDLVQGVEEPSYEFGRPTLPRKDLLFCTIQKVYSQLSSRRAHSLYKKAQREGYIREVPNYDAINKLLNEEELTPVLQRLIRLSAKPLNAVEKNFALDSTGFRTTNFNRYAEDKHHIHKERKWIKAHIASGITTNIVTSVELTEENAGDSTKFKPLLSDTAEQGFEINEVYADKAYLSRNNYEAVKSLGGRAFIPFKKNSTGSSQGSLLWRKMWAYFEFNREDFIEHYGKRENVESTIHAIKAKFGETLKSKKPTAQKNELLCKILAYNITVLIQEMHELETKRKF